MKIRNIAIIFILSVIFSPDLSAGPIPSGQMSGAQSSRFTAESQKRAMAAQRKNFDKKKRTGTANIEFKDVKPANPATASDKDLGKDAKD